MADKDVWNYCEHSWFDSEDHGCPFEEEIRDDYEFTCNCCKECTHECAMDI